MKLLALIFLGIGVVLIIIHFIFAGPTYYDYKFGIMHTSLPIAASFVIGAGVTLLLVDYNVRKEGRRRMPPRDSDDFHDTRRPHKKL